MTDVVEPPLAVILLAAIEDGEILRVRYDGGSQPGAVREIRPLALDGRRLRARDVSPRPKWFFLAKLAIVPLETPLSYVPHKSKRKPADPRAFVQGWRFLVPMPTRADAFDITSAKRTRTNVRTGKKEIYWVWTQGDPPEYQFQIGDTFHCPHEAAREEWGTLETHYAVQVEACEGDNVVVRIHAFRFGRATESKRGLRLTAAEFLALLRAGLDPESWLRLVC